MKSTIIKLLLFLFIIIVSYILWNNRNNDNSISINIKENFIVPFITENQINTSYFTFGKGTTTKIIYAFNNGKFYRCLDYISSNTTNDFYNVPVKIIGGLTLSSSMKIMPGDTNNIKYIINGSNKLVAELSIDNSNLIFTAISNGGTIGKNSIVYNKNVYSLPSNELLSTDFNLHCFRTEANKKISDYVIILQIDNNNKYYLQFAKKTANKFNFIGTPVEIKLSQSKISDIYYHDNQNNKCPQLITPLPKPDFSDGIILFNNFTIKFLHS